MPTNPLSMCQEFDFFHSNNINYNNSSYFIGLHKKNARAV